MMKFLNRDCHRPAHRHDYKIQTNKAAGGVLYEDRIMQINSSKYAPLHWQRFPISAINTLRDIITLQLAEFLPQKWSRFLK